MKQETFEPVLDSLGNPRLVIVRDDPKTGLGRFRENALGDGDLRLRPRGGIRHFIVEQQIVREDNDLLALCRLVNDALRDTPDTDVIERGYGVVDDDPVLDGILRAAPSFFSEGAGASRRSTRTSLRSPGLFAGDFCPRGRNFRARTGPCWAPDPAGFRPPSSAPRPASEGGPS